MALRNWTIDLDGREHTVTLNWTYWGGEREVLVDGRVVNEDKKFLRWESHQEFELDGHHCAVITRPQRSNITEFDIELRVDGRVIAPIPQ